MSAALIEGARAGLSNPTWTPTGAAYDDRDLLAEALRQLYAAANGWRGEPELDPALDAASEALRASHWPTRWQADPLGGTSSSASSQSTRTIFVCPECHLVGEAAAWCYGYPLKHPRRERIPVEVVELSRLRAAEERVRHLGDLLTRVEAAIGNHPKQRLQTAGMEHVVDDLHTLIDREMRALGMVVAERDRLAGAWREGIPFVQQAALAIDKEAGVSSTPLTRWLEDWLKRGEALASLEGGDE